MKMRKGISAVLAGVMALAALLVSAMSASAEGAYALGDVDMDGYITGHDAAMVTHALYVDNNALNDEQLKLADVNGDGTVDQSDADWIHENEEYALGDVQQSGMCTITAFYLATYLAKNGAGYAMQSVETAYPASSVDLDIMLDKEEIPVVTYNLMDVDGDGTLSVEDLFLTLVSIGRMGCGYSSSVYFEDNRYDLTESSLDLVDNCADSSAWSVINMDGKTIKLYYK